jgi:hypothetical protein
MTKTPASLLERLRGSFDADAWHRFVARRFTKRNRGTFKAIR